MKKVKNIIQERDFELFLENSDADDLFKWAAQQFSEENEDCYEIAIKLYEIAGEKGCANALNNLGALYSEGLFVEMDMEKAFEYYKKACECGSYEACCNLGYFYLYGRNGEVDKSKAYDYFSRGAMLGNDANCLYKLGDMYIYGDHVQKNPAVAYSFYLKALEMLEKYGSSYEEDFVSDIYYRIGKCLYEGNGIKQDKFEAIRYLFKAKRGYKTRKNDAYEYVNKRIGAIDYMLEHCYE